ncbi:chorismate mutase [Sulfitobacter pacificus]|uniref:chorismate mutase n=1 Tax=Sulfitobacter pacificus TaxID=1499314 RepID=UPI003106098D
MQTKAPQDCNTMAELRVQIDALDDKLIEMLVTRSSYIDRAVELKRIEGLPARITDRVQEVLRKVTDNARTRGLDPELAAEIWTTLIEWSIAREAKHLDVDQHQ